MPEDEELENNSDENPGDGELEDKESPKLLAGKYANPEELEKAYLHEQAAMTKAQQEAADLRRQLEEMTGSYNNTSPSPPSATGQTWADDFNERMWDNPATAMTEILQNAFAIRDQAEAGIETALAEKESHPLYREVATKYRAELKRNAMYLGDPANSKAVADALFKQVVGEYALAAAEKVRENPAERTAMLRNLGIESPQSEGGETKTVTTREDIEMLRDIGVPKDRISTVVDRFTKEEGED